MAGADDDRDAPPEATAREASSPRRRYSRAWTFSARLSFDPIANASVHARRRSSRPGGIDPTAAIRVGSVAESGGGGAPVAFAFEPLDHDAVARGWRLEPAEGTVQPGDIENVVVTFEPRRRCRRDTSRITE